MASCIPRHLWQPLQPVAGPSRLVAQHRRLLPAAQLSSVQQNRRAFTSTSIDQSGHNKWSKIRHKKGAVDQAKSRVWGRIAEVAMAALKPPNSPDPSKNSVLAEQIQKAKEVGMPKSIIDRHIARAKSAADGTGQTLFFEAMGASGKDAYIIECMTDNPRRTSGNVKDIIKKHGGHVTPVGFMFEKKGLILVEPVDPATSYDTLFELALEEGADDVIETETEDGMEWEVHTPLELLAKIANTISNHPEKLFRVRSFDPAYIANQPLEIEEDDKEMQDHMETMEKFSVAVENDGDVVKMWSNVSGL